MTFLLICQTVSLSLFCFLSRVLCELTKMLKMQIFSKCLGILSMKYAVLWSQLCHTLMFYQWHWDRGIRGPELVGTHSLRVFPALMRRCLDTTICVWSRLIMAPCCLSKQSACKSNNSRVLRCKLLLCKPMVTICVQTASQTLQIRSRCSDLKQISLQRRVCVCS